MKFARMTFRLALCSLCSVPLASAIAQTNNGFVGVFGDAAATIRCMQAQPGIPTTLYVIASVAGATADGITGAEFRIEFQNAAGYFLHYTPPQNAQVLGHPLNGVGVNITWPTCQLPTEGRISLGTIMALNLGSGMPTSISVQRRNPPYNASYPCALFVLCDTPVYSKSCMTFPADSLSCLTNKAIAIPGRLASEQFLTELNTISTGQFLEVIGGPGTIFAYGARLSGPFLFTQIGDSLFVNGAPFSPRAATTAQVEQGKVTDQAGGAMARRKYAITERACIAAREYFTAEEQLKAMVDVYKSDPLVALAAIELGGVRVRYSDGRSEIVNTPRLPRTTDNTLRDRTESLDRERSLVRRLVESGGLVAFGRGYTFYCQPDDASAALQIAQRLFEGSAVAESELHNSPLAGVAGFQEDLRRQRSLQE